MPEPARPSVATPPAPAAAPARKQERGLERQQIVQAALELLNETGFSGLTLRRLAAKLHVKAAALYWHFANKQDLIDAMAHDMLVAEYRAAPPPQPAAWPLLLGDIGRVNRRALERYRDGAQVMTHANMAQYDLLEGMEFVLGQLQQQGFPAQLAVLSFFTIIRYTVGCVVEEQADPRGTGPQAQARRHKFMQTVAERFPVSAGIFQEVAALGMTPEDRFEQGLRIVLAGIQQQLDAARRLP